MSEANPHTPSAIRADRRDFIKTAAGTAAAAAAFTGAARGQGTDPSKKLKIGFVGTGGRGTGAAENALSGDDNVELYAMADLFQDRIDLSLETLNKRKESKKFPGTINVPAERQFTGFDGFQKVLDSGVDVILLTTTPGFRPLHLRAAVERGVHIFAEKPMAVDAAGVRHVYETLKMAEGKPISIVAGFCWRYSPSRVMAYKKVMEEGLIGDITSIYATYYSGHSKPHLPAEKRTPEMSDIEWQIRNWYNYNWLGGSGLVEQAVHSVDKIGWVMGDQSPLSCRATGGLASPQAGGGNIFDHFHVAYEFPNNVWAHLGSRKAEGCKNENADFIAGTEGKLIIGRGSAPYIIDKAGETVWSFRLPRGEREESMYQVEHNEFFNSIRTGEFINDGPRMIHSSMMAIMGRMSAETGAEVTWEQAMAADEDLFPGDESDIRYDQSHTPPAVAIPGKTKIGGIGKA